MLTRVNIVTRIGVPGEAKTKPRNAPGKPGLIIGIKNPLFLLLDFANFQTKKILCFSSSGLSVFRSSGLKKILYFFFRTFGLPDFPD